MRNIRNMAPLSVTSIYMLKLFTSHIIKHVSALMVLTSSYELLEWDYELVDVIVDKLDAASRRKWKLMLRAVTSNSGDVGLWTLLEFLVVRCKNFMLEEDEPRPSDLMNMSAKCHVCTVRHYYYPLSTLIVSGEVKFRRIAGFNLCKDCLRRGHVHSICIMSLHCGKCQLYHEMCRNGGGMEPSRLVIALSMNFESASDYIQKRLRYSNSDYSINHVISMKSILFDEIDDVSIESD